MLPTDSMIRKSSSGGIGKMQNEALRDSLPRLDLVYSAPYSC
jgi:hypothetical protein